MADRPGVMLYFNTRPALRFLSNEEKGALFEAILNYGEFGILPEFSGLLGMAWSFIQPMLDRDAASYENTIKKRKYAAYCKQCKEKRAVPLPMEEWEKSICNHMDAHDSKCNPIAISEAVTTANSMANTMSTPTANGTTAGKGSGENPSDTSVDFEQLRQQQIRKLQGLK